MRSDKKSDSDQFDDDYNKILPKFKSVIEDSGKIKNLIEERIKNDDPAQIMNQLRESIRRAIKNLGEVQQFLIKYGYHEDVEKIKEYFRKEKN